MTALGRVLPLPAAARAYYAVVAASALAAGVAAVARIGPETAGWPTFLVLASSAAGAQLFIVRTGRSHGFHTAIVVMAGLGVAMAALWTTNPWLAPAAVAPLVLSHRSIRLLGRARDSEERFRTMFEAAPIGMVVRDLDGALLSTNPAFERMLGYTT